MPSNDQTAAPKRLLTIQDVSCVGQCSATVALPLVSACGVECAALPSAVLSNHTGGFPSWTFRDLTADMAGIEAEWNKQGIRFDAFYTGYVCEPQIDPILSIMEHCAAPGALRFVDPAMADNGKLYVGFGADFPSKMARLCKGADFILPNGAGGMVVFGVKGGSKEARAFADSLNGEIFSLLANVGDAKSLVIHPASTTHSQLSDDDLRKGGVLPELVRLSIGLEHIDDIIAELDRALEAV